MTKVELHAMSMDELKHKRDSICADLLESVDSVLAGDEANCDGEDCLGCKYCAGSYDVDGEMDAICRADSDWVARWKDIYLQLTGHEVGRWRELKEIIERILELERAGMKGARQCG